MNGVNLEGLFYTTTAIIGFFAAAYLCFSVKKTRAGGLHKTLLLYLISIIFISTHILIIGLTSTCTSNNCYALNGFFGLIAEIGFVVFFYASYKLYFYIKTFKLED